MNFIGMLVTHNSGLFENTKFILIVGDSITDGHILGNDKTQIEDSDYYNDAISRTDVDIEGYLWDTDPETGTVPIPYKIDHNIDDQTRDNIDQAISEFHRDTCIR